MGRPKKTDNNTQVIIDEIKTPKNDPVKNLLGSLLNGYKEDHYNFVKNERLPLSTGSLLLDSYVKLKTGSVVRLAGPLESGKTSQILLLIKNYLEAIPNSRGLYVKGEGRLSEELQARSGLKFVFSEEDWDVGTVFVYECNVFEAVCDMIFGLLKSMHEHGEKLVFAIDSLDGMGLRKDLQEKNAGDNVQPAGVPKMTKMFFRRLALPINKYDALALLSSQYSETFKIDMYAKDKPQPVQGAGGSSLSHQPDWILEYGVRYTSHYILEDESAKPDPVNNKNLGHVVNITLRKTTNEKTGTKIEVPIKYGEIGNSIWKSREVCDLSLLLNLTTKTGKTYSFSTDVVKEAKDKGIEVKESVVGVNNFYKYLDENKPFCDFLYEKIKNVLD